MKTSLILGSTGVIGRSLKNYLELRGEFVLTVNFDLTNRKRLNELEYLITQSDYLYFLAFNSGNKSFRDDQEYSLDFINSNIDIMRNTFEVIEKAKIPFLFASTYQTKNPQNTYAVLKTIGEQYTIALCGTVIRLWNVYGQQDIKTKETVINKFLKEAKTGKIDLMSYGSFRKQFLYVEDLVRALRYIRDNEYPDTKIDISSGKWNTLRDVAEIISDLTKCSIIENNTIHIQNSSDLVEPAWSNLLDDWTPEFSLRRGINDLFKRS